MPDGPTSGDSTAYETELRQHRRANEATNPKRVNMQVAELQDIIIGKTFHTKIQNKSLFSEFFLSFIHLFKQLVFFT